MTEATVIPPAPAPRRRTLATLWDTLGLSIILGLLLMIIGVLGRKTPLNTLQFSQITAQIDSLIWAVIVCVGVTYAKVASKGDPSKTAAAGLGSVALAMVLTNLRKGAPSLELAEGLRIIVYPVLAATVTRLEKLHLGFLAKGWKWLVPVILVPGLAVGLKDGFWPGVAECVFAAGCALILHAKKAPGAQPVAAAAPAKTA